MCLDLCRLSCPSYGVQFTRQKEIFKKEKKILKKSRSHRIKEPSLWSLGGPTGDCPLPVVISRGFMIYYTYRGGDLWDLSRNLIAALVRPYTLDFYLYMYIVRLHGIYVWLLCLISLHSLPPLVVHRKAHSATLEVCCSGELLEKNGKFPLDFPLGVVLFIRVNSSK